MKLFLVYGYTSEMDCSDSFQSIKVVTTEERAKELSEEWQTKKEVENGVSRRKGELQLELSKLFSSIQHKQNSYDTRPKLPSNYNMSKATAKDLGYTDEMWKYYVKQNETILINTKATQKKWDEEEQNIRNLINQDRERIVKEYVEGLSPEDKVIWCYTYGNLHDNYTYEEVEAELD